MKQRVEVHQDGEQNYWGIDSASTASLGSSPRSIGAGKGSPNDHHLPPKWDDAAFLRVKLMCSYGGNILPRPHDNQLRYVGGETRIVVVNRHLSYGELDIKLARMFGAGVIIKYQLPSEDLDALISVTSDEDMENMMEECDRLQSCKRPSRLRLFLFPRKIDSQTSLSDLLNSNMNREHLFLDALNGLPVLSIARSETSSVVSEVPDYLFGLDDWTGYPLLTYSPNSRQNAAERSSTRVLGSLREGSGDISSAPGSPLNRRPSTAVPSPSSAPPSLSSMNSAVINAVLQRLNRPKPATGQLQMEELSSDVPIQQKLRGSEEQNSAENSVQQVTTGLRQQQSSEASKFADQRYLHDEVTAKMAKLILEQQQAVELPATSKPKIQPQESLHPTNSNVMNPEMYNRQVETAPLIDRVFETKDENSRYPKEESPRYTKEESSRQTRTVSKPAGEVKLQEAEAPQKVVPIHQGNERIVKKVSEDRAGERMVEEQMRQFDDENVSRRQLVEPATDDSFQQADGFVDSGSESSSEPEITTVKMMQEQEGLYAQFRNLHVASVDSTSTYATQPPTVQLQNLANTTPSNVLTQQQPSTTTTTTTAIYPESLPLRVAAANPVLPSSHVQRQSSDPLQHIASARVTGPYRDHSAAHALPSRFRGAGPPVYPNSSDMKRVILRPAGPQAHQSRPPLAPQYNDQIPYHVTYIDSNGAYANYSQFSAPTTPEYAGHNPFVEDMRPFPEVPVLMYQEVYVDPGQDTQGMIDGRVQGRQYCIMRN